MFGPQHTPTPAQGTTLRAALIAAVAIFALSACSDPPNTAVDPIVPCGGACDPSQCVLGMCVDDEPDVGGEPDGDVGEPDPDVVDKTCEVDGDCDDEEYCFVANDNADGVCTEGCRIDPDNCDEGSSCDEEERVCVDDPPQGCEADGDCEDGELCDIADGEDTGECIEADCRVDDDCDEGSTCNVPEGQGVGQCAEGCREDSECPEGLECQDGACVGEDPCDADEDCPEGTFCDTDLGFCLPGCIVDEDCGDPDLTCVDNVCTGAVCDVDEDCLPAQYCDDDAGACLQGCRDDDSCGAAEICDETTRACIEGCREDVDCLGGQYCDEDTLTCLDGCRDDDECDIGNECQLVDIGGEVFRQECAPIICGGDGDCPEDFFCNDEDICDLGCREGGCPENLACDPDTRECVEDACENSDECPDGTYCDLDIDPASCVPGCDDNSQCPSDQPCNLDTNTCGCAAPEDCPNGQICSLGLCIVACASDDDCEDGTFCELDSGLCVEGCRDDVFEPNDAHGAAVPITEGDFEMRMCYDPLAPATDDCFSLPLLEDDTLRVNATFRHEDGDIDLSLYNVSQVVLRISDTLDDNESIEFVAEQDGTVVLCVEPQGATFDSDYGLTIDVEAALGCIDDVDEANNNNTCQDVVGDPLLLDIGVEEVITGRTICEGDEDFVPVQMRTGQELTVRIERGVEDDDLDIQMINSDCGNALAQTDELGPIRDFTFRAPADGVFAVRVFGELAEFEGTYDLIMTLEAGNAQCPDDVIEDLPVEPNEDTDGATILRFPRETTYDVPDLNLCNDGDVDVYQVIVDVPSDIIRVNLRQSIADVPLRMELLDVDGTTVLASNEEALAEKTLETDALDNAGSYFLRITATEEVPDAGVAYSMDWLINSSDACTPDQFEPNNILEGASPIGGGIFDLTMCRTDANEADFYSLELGAGDELRVEMEYDNNIIDFMPAIIYGPGGFADLRDLTFPGGDSESVGPIVVSPSDIGTWFIGVENSGVGESLDYTMTIDVVTQQCEDGIDEPFEPNEDCGSSTDLPIFESVEGAICSPEGDRDFYGIDVAEGANLTIRMDYFHFDGNLDIIVYDPSNTRIGESFDSLPDAEEFVVQNATAGRYCVEVFATGNLTINNYSIGATIE